MGTAEHAAMKALELISILSVRDPKHLMSQIDHQGHPTIRKAALFRMECCLSFREAESLNIGRKGRRGEKAVDSQDQPPIDADSSRHPCTMVVLTKRNSPRHDSQSGRYSVEKMFLLSVYHVTDGTEAQDPPLSPCIHRKNRGTISINQETTHVRSLLTLTRFTAHIHPTAPHLHFGRCVSLLLFCASALDWLSLSLLLLLPRSVLHHLLLMSL